jgi:phage terminase large subunit
VVISSKQSKIPENIKAGKRQIFLIGSLGTSKTFGAAVAILSVAIKYPGSVIPVARKNLTELKRGTLLSFHEAAQEMGLTQYRENRQEMTWTFENGSIIMFLELDHTKDPQFSKIKSINATCAMIDESDGVIEGAYIALYSRTGRHNKNGAPAFILTTCNPNESWVKLRAYNPFKKPKEYGKLPADTAVVEFEPKDSFLGSDYYDRFEDMPLPWKKRYLWNDWDYGDDDNSVFKYRFMDRCHVEKYAPALRFTGNDVARTGRDRSVIAMWEGNCLVDIKITKDTDEQVDTADQADMLYQYNTDNVVGAERSIVDGIGVGVGVIDGCRKLGHAVKSFVAGAKSTKMTTVREKSVNGTVRVIQIPLYNNLRSEAAFVLANDIEKGLVQFYDGCPLLSDFKKEATMHNFEIRDRQMILESKDKVKERLGHSPDLFDAVVMSYWLQKKQGQADTAIISTGGDYDDLYGKGMMDL